MKSVNGMFLLFISVLILWIGVTGRFPALVAAFGLVKNSTPGTSTGGGSTFPSSTSGTDISRTGKTDVTGNSGIDLTKSGLILPLLGN